MAIAAVPDYLLVNDFASASPGLRFGLYLQVWGNDFTNQKDKAEPLKRAGKLNSNDVATMKAVFERQQASFKTIAGGTNTLQLEAIATAPFATGLGNEHPTENGFAFLNPYGLPYLPGSGVKGVIRQAARELASGEWGDSGWTDEYITALFGPEAGAEASAEALTRGALTFWDVIPQIKSEQLTVEIMTPHQQHYYQSGESPHDSGQPIPITFLTVPAGSGFTFHVQCNRALLQRLAPALIDDAQWQMRLQAAFAHAFAWLGFGAKTAGGYGAMQEDEAKQAARQKKLHMQLEEKRRSTLSPEELAYDEHQPVIQQFRLAFEQASKGTYQAGQEFDSKRNDFIGAAQTLRLPTC
jgi:CRISPR-associated protein Cmr6